MADRTAWELRRAQFELADDGESRRAEVLGAIVDRSTQSLAPGDRPAFLEELERRFPAWDAGVSAGALAPVARSGFDEAELARPDFLVRKLLELGGGLSDDERTAIADRLSEAGFRSTNERTSGSPWSAETEKRLREALGLTPDKRVGRDRVARTAVLLTEFVTGLETGVWPIWSMVAPGSSVRRSGNVLDLVRGFLAEDAETGGSAVRKHLEQLRLLVFWLSEAVATAARQAQEEYGPLAPRAIERRVDSQGGSPFKHKKVAYWDEYVEAHREFLAGGEMQHRLLAAVAKYVESKMQSHAPRGGAGAGSGSA